MAENTIKMGEKLVKVAVLVLLIARGACSTNVAKFKISSPLEVTYENKITKSAVTRIACLSLCNEGCRFVEYSGSGPNTGVCDLYYLKDAMFDRLKKLQIASGYIKVYPNDKVFVGMPDLLNWNQSKLNCENAGWKLATAEESSLFDRTMTLMQNNDYWLGATKESGVWRWLSGVPMSPLPVENDPVQYAIKCLFIWNGGLDDGICTYMAMHVCEITF